MFRRKLDTPFPPPVSYQSASPATTTTNDLSPSIMITVLILAIAVILSASLYLLLRCIRRHRHSTTLPHSFSSSSAASLSRVSPVDKNPLIESLPLFTFDSLTGKTNKNNNSSIGGDCAVCLSKFEGKDVLRLLPICCHAFHAECIDTWLNANQSCPLCRSPIFLTANEILGKLSSEHSRSFRVEIGNVSNRRGNVNSSGEIRRSYSLGGSFDYVVDDDVVSEVPGSSFRRTSLDFKVDPTVTSVEQGALAAEVGTRGGGGGWLKDYLSCSSRTMSFRGSGRWFFTGSSRRSTVDVTAENHFRSDSVDLEASRLGDEIGELFRWLSGV